MLAVVALDPGKAALQVAAAEKLFYHLGAEWAQEAVAGLQAFFIVLEKRAESVILRHTPIGSSRRNEGRITTAILPYPAHGPDGPGGFRLRKAISGIY